MWAFSRALDPSLFNICFVLALWLHSKRSSNVVSTRTSKRLNKHKDVTCCIIQTHIDVKNQHMNLSNGDNQQKSFMLQCMRWGRLTNFTFSLSEDFAVKHTRALLTQDVILYNSFILLLFCCDFNSLFCIDLLVNI